MPDPARPASQVALARSCRPGGQR